MRNSLSRKIIESKGGPTAKSKTTSANSKARQGAAEQRIAISHYREEDFKADGLRTYAKYRDLEIAEASHGLAQAHVIRLVGPCNPAEVSKLHYHDVEFQMVDVLKGWVKTYMEGQGETLMKEGSAWTQPPRIKHLIMDYSDDVELLEVICRRSSRRWSWRTLDVVIRSCSSIAQRHGSPAFRDPARCHVRRMASIVAGTRAV